MYPVVMMTGVWMVNSLVSEAYKITIVLFFSYMFWTDHGYLDPGVFKTKLDGTGFEYVVQSETTSPNGLAIDLFGK